ncbi:unnamed protein product [Owenia fusiformis]|uniref:Protein rogdi n=1 Tax=Owenia fusiformis TaxID=6347 RepID=A0A8S4Q5H5_OWEFU|nr:unnamed protein product [Owenia fusiformis]
MAEKTEEVDNLRTEFDWLLKEEVHRVFDELKTILKECCNRFPVMIYSGNNDEILQPEKFILASSNGTQNYKCMVTILGDSICEADLSLRVNKPTPAIQKSQLTPGETWRLQQVQDAGNHLMNALTLVSNIEKSYTFKTGQEVVLLLNDVTSCLNRGRACLTLPRKKSLEELVHNRNMKIWSPPVPNDIVLSFYIQAQKLVLGVYQLQLNSAQKLDIGAKHTIECSVPWLNDAIVLYTIALQRCQQLLDKVNLFMELFESRTALYKQTTDKLDSDHIRSPTLISFET